MTEDQQCALAHEMAHFKAYDVWATGERGVMTYVAEDAYHGRVGYAQMTEDELRQEIGDWIELEYIDLDDEEFAGMFPLIDEIVRQHEGAAHDHD